MARLVNGARQAGGLGALAPNRAQAVGARKHSQSMGSAGRLRHMTLNGRLSWAVPGSSAGENVGYGGGAQMVFQMLMNSPPHRANILGGRFRTMGVGAASACGTIYFALRFQG